MNEKTNPRDAILAAAKARIMHYGYGKTTMAEIARDCDMSAGNIYRFFESKLDIAEALGRQVQDEFDLEKAAIATDPGRTPPERLRILFEAIMERSYDLLDKNDKFLEVAEVLGNERPKFMNDELARERIHIVRILNDGMKRGDFRRLEDPEFTAEMIQSATMKFSYPQQFSHLRIDALRRELRGVMDLILAGLGCRA